jgi:hypothetical protein
MSLFPKRVVIESPLAGDFKSNKIYAKKCMKDSLSRGEAPYASHLLFDQFGILDDTKQEEREQGIIAGFAWGEMAELVAVYTDFGISDGMKRGIERAEKSGIAIEYRTLQK